jgi:hypothetical protein
MFHIVQPCANGPRRFQHATVVSSHRNVDGAFDELERIRGILDLHGLAALASDLAVVTEYRSPVHTRQQALEMTPRGAPVLDQPPVRSRRDRKMVLEIKISPTEGWNFDEPASTEHIALVPRLDGHLEVWRLEPDGTFSRMSAVEEALGPMPRVNEAELIEDAALMASFEPLPQQPVIRAAATSRVRARSFWSEYHVRIRWPKAVRPVKAALEPHPIPQLSSRAS